MNKETEYLMVEVSRKQFATLCMQVPKGWRPGSGDTEILAKACADTLMRWDWDNHPLKETVAAESVRVVEPAETEYEAIYTVPAP